jgi:shikimate dehydrogenase
MKNSPEPARYAVVGDPVAHSLSPLIHNAWMHEAGLDAHYERVHLKSENAAADIHDMARAY